MDPPGATTPLDGSSSRCNDDEVTGCACKYAELARSGTQPGYLRETMPNVSDPHHLVTSQRLDFVHVRHRTAVGVWSRNWLQQGPKGSHGPYWPRLSAISPTGAAS